MSRKQWGLRITAGIILIAGILTCQAAETGRRAALSYIDQYWTVSQVKKDHQLGTGYLALHSDKRDLVYSLNRSELEDWNVSSMQPGDGAIFTPRSMWQIDFLHINRPSSWMKINLVVNRPFRTNFSISRWSSVTRLHH